MIKKVFISVSCALICGLSANASASFDQGLYLNIGSGIQSIQSAGHSKISIEINPPNQLGALETTDFRFNDVNSDYFGEIGLGFGRFVNRWYWGMQGDYQVFSGQGALSFTELEIPAIWETSVNYTESTRILNQYTLSGILGYRWSSMLGFLRLGYVNAGARYSAHMTFHEAQHGNVTSYFSPTVSERLQGYEVGLGARFPFIGRMDLNMEYDFILYAPENFSDSAVVTQFQVPLTYSTHSRQSIQSQAAKFSLIYHF